MAVCCLPWCFSSALSPFHCRLLYSSFVVNSSKKASAPCVGKGARKYQFHETEGLLPPFTVLYFGKNFMFKSVWRLERKEAPVDQVQSPAPHQAAHNHLNSSFKGSVSVFQPSGRLCAQTYIQTHDYKLTTHQVCLCMCCI